VINGILQSASMQFTQEARLKQDSIDRTNETIAQLSALQKTEQQKLETLRLRLRTRQDRAKRISNLKRWLEPQRHMLSINAGAADLHEKRKIGYADAEGAGIIIKADDLPYELRQAGEHLIRQASGGLAYLSTPLPLSRLSPSEAQLSPLVQSISTSVLRHRIDMYTQANAALLNRSRKLKDKDGQLEAMFRQVVCLCTNVDESRIDEVLPSLVAALDSDPLDGVEVGRVREFLRKVEGVEA
jgi:regulatory protein SWI6